MQMVGIIKKAVLKHQPTCFYAFWRPALVKHKSFLHPKALWSIGGEDWLVGSGCFPVTWSSCPVWTSTIGVFPVSWAKEKPLALPKQGFSCTGKQNNNGKENDASRYPKLGYQKSNFFFVPKQQENPHLSIEIMNNTLLERHKNIFWLRRMN
jgi:hypothetical protein